MKTKTRIASILYVLFAIVYVVMHILPVQGILANFFIAASGLCAFCYCMYQNRKEKNNKLFIAFCAMLTMLMVFSMLYNSNADILDVLWIWAYGGMAALMYEFEIPEKIYWLCALAFMFLILVYIISGGSPQDFLYMGSENNISAYLIFFLLAAYLSRMKKRKSINFIPPFLCMAICLWSGSRAGALSAAVLIACVFCYNFFAIKKGRALTLLKIFALLCVVMWATSNFFGEYLTLFIQKLNHYGATSIRTKIWVEYINAAFDNAGNFIFGVNATSPAYELLSFYGGNPHNAFLTMHAKFGIVGLLLLLALVCKVIAKAIGEKNHIMIIVLVVACTRMLFDWIAFPGIYDILFWYMLLYVMDPNTKYSKIECKIGS